jgi:hypothetical protein
LTSAGLATGQPGWPAMEPTRCGGGGGAAAGGAAVVWARAAALEIKRINAALRRWCWESWIMGSSGIGILYLAEGDPWEICLG